MENYTFQELVDRGGRNGYVHLCSKNLKIDGDTDINKNAIKLYRKIVMELRGFKTMNRNLYLGYEFVVIITPLKGSLNRTKIKNKAKPE